MDKISKHISYKEATRSNTALRRGIDNIPDVEELENMKLIAEKVFEPLREHVGGPIKINSFYRSPELNVAIGGSKKSQHCKGQAIDLDDTYYIIKEDENTIIALLEDSHSFSVANVSTIVFYKDISYLISTNVNDLGITINQGGCYNY